MGKAAYHVSRLVLIGSFSYLQVRMLYIRAWMSSKFGWIGSQTTEVAALGRMKKSHRLIMEKTTSSYLLRFFHRILSILAGNEDKHKSLNEFEFRIDPTSNSGVTCTCLLASKKSMSSLISASLVAIDPILFKLTGNEKMNKNHE